MKKYLVSLAFAWSILLSCCAEEVVFETEVTFRNGIQFRSMRARTISLANNLRWSVEQIADAYLCTVEDVKTEQVLYLWGGSERTIFAAGRRDRKGSVGVIPLDEGGLTFGGHETKWNTLAQVPIEIRRDSMDRVFSGGGFAVKDDALEGIGTVDVLGFASVNTSLCPTAGGALTVTIDGQTLTAFFDGKEILSLDSMAENRRNGLSLGWKKGVLIQYGTYVKGAPWDGVFVADFRDDCTTFKEMEKGNVMKRWEIPLKSDNP